MSLALKPAHASVKGYYFTLHEFGQLFIDHEGAVRSAFHTLLAKCGQKASPKLTLVPEYRIERARSSVIVDGALVDLYHLPHGYWEAKDEQDDLAREVDRKLEKGYPRDNIIFQAPERAILYQGGSRILDLDISRPEPLVEIVNTFFDYKAPHIQEWEDAVRDFSGRIPELASAVKKTIDEERKRNPSFVRSFEDFCALCRAAINPDLSREAVERMLVQHLLTERIFRKIFNNPDFTRRNIIAAEIEKVISELTQRAFNRDEFLSGLDRFYRAIEQSAESTTSFSEKQAFLNKVYERFFQGYSPKEADTHGIVYTPQPIVSFMVRSVEEILQKEFGRSLGDRNVHILDPFVGTGNFIVRLMQDIKATDLEYKYEKELHCNEVMLLPYYIASMNIEHAFFERTGAYKPFPGICLVDTFELAEPDQALLTFVTKENTDRVKKQKKEEIFVIVGNPPYNVGQTDENEANPNRKYETVDKRLAATYRAHSSASSTTKLGNAYVKAIRWASDRIGPEGLIALVTNNGFIRKRVFDGMRKCLHQEFTAVYVLDLGGDVRDNPKLSGTTHNVFGIQPGVSINFFVRRASTLDRTHAVHYARVDEYWRKEQKYRYLDETPSTSDVEWETIEPRSDGTWLSDEVARESAPFVPMVYAEGAGGIFRLHSMGVNTNRDAWAFNYNVEALTGNIQRTLDFYNLERMRWHSARQKSLDKLSQDGTKIKWSSSLKAFLRQNIEGSFNSQDIRTSLYRPFTTQFLYFNSLLTHRRARLPRIFPTAGEDGGNVLICVPGPGNRKQFGALATKFIPAMDLAFEKAQCFPFYTFDKDGSQRSENISDTALEQFRIRYADHSLTKWDVFDYIYAILHHPEYCQRYAARLRSELPSIPFAYAPAADKDADDLFRRLVTAGRRLREIHVNFEQQPEFALTKTEKAGEKLDWRVTKMRLTKDKTSILYNQFLTLSGIPADTYEYRLGNRSALEWIIDQYQISSDKRSGITNDPNREEDPTYIVRLVGQVITISIETVQLVRSLPPVTLR